MSISDNQINMDQPEMISIPYDFRECNIFKKEASVKAVKILNQLNNFEKIILFQEYAYGESSDFYIKSYFWDFHIITFNNNQYNYYLYCLEDFYLETKESYIFKLKCFLEELFYNPYYHQEYKNLSRSNIYFLKHAENLLIEKMKTIEDRQEDDVIML